MRWLLEFAAFIATVLTTALSQQLADEFKAWVPWLVNRFIERAVCQLPAGQQDRYREEWHSHINDLPGEIAKLIAAIGFCSAARGMRQLLTPTLIQRLPTIVGGTLAVILLAPAMLSVAVATWISSGRPIFRETTAIDDYGNVFVARRFVIFKPMLGQEADGTGRRDRYRLTHLGRTLYRYGLDLLPLFLSVMGGHISFTSLARRISGIDAQED